LRSWAALLVVVGVAVWGASLKNGFVYDDDGLVVQNAALRSLSPLSKFLDPASQSSSSQANRFSYRPLTTFVHAAAFQVNGLDPRVFHGLSIAFHIANALVLFGLMILLSRSATTAGIVSAVFLLHPIQAESVAWVGAFSNPLAGFFVLMSLVLFLGSRETGRAYGASLACFVLALLAKESSIALPLLVALLVLFQRESVEPKPALCWKPLAPYFVIALAYGLLNAFMRGQAGQTGYLAGGFWPQMLTMTKGFAYYVKMALLPHPLRIDYLFPFKTALDAEVLLCAGLLAGLLYSGWRFWKKRSLAGLGILFFFASLAPVSNIVPINTLINERYLYLAIIGYGMVVSVVAEEVQKRWAGLEQGEAGKGHGEVGQGHGWVGKDQGWVWLGVVLGVFYLCLTVGRIRDWRDSYSLAKADLAVVPESSRLRLVMGRGFWDRGEWHKAGEQYLLSLAGGETSEACLGLGSAYIRLQDFDQAVSWLSRAAVLEPDSAAIRNNLSVAYASKGDMAAAIQQLALLLRSHPGDPKANHNLMVFQAALEVEKERKPARRGLSKK
jgi:tetratricopeptide (TPR) repeat protein